MKVLLKSLKELNVIERRDGYLIVDGTILCNDMINLLGKVHEARYDKDYDSYIIDEYDFDSSIIKKKITTYTIDTIFTVKEEFSNSKGYIYRVGEKLEVESIHRCRFNRKALYTLISADPLTDPFTIEYKTVILSEDELELSLIADV